MRGQVALVREQGQSFAVLAVKPGALCDPEVRDSLLRLCQTQFGVRAALLAEDGRTWGPSDIVRWLSGVPAAALPWREFWINA
jgi:hypothetical protein